MEDKSRDKDTDPAQAQASGKVENDEKAGIVQALRQEFKNKEMGEVPAWMKNKRLLMDIAAIAQSGRWSPSCELAEDWMLQPGSPDFKLFKKARWHRLELLILGKKGTPYEDGMFFVDVCIPPDYPFKGPVMKFMTKIYHPCTNERGDCGHFGIPNDHCHTWSPKIKLLDLCAQFYEIVHKPSHGGGLWPEVRIRC